MTPNLSVGVDLFGACQQLLCIAAAQTDSLHSSDFDRFDQLFDQRAQLAHLIDEQTTPALRLQVRERLQAVAQLDQENIVLARQLLEETARALKQIHHGQTALRGYGRPGAGLSRPASLVDRAS